MVVLSGKEEVADFQDADQFPTGKSQFMCGFFACYIAKSMAQVGKPPLLSTQQIIQDALLAYSKFDGDPSIANTDGMTLAQEYALLAQIGLHYQATQASWPICKEWLQMGYPVLVAVNETSVFDITLNAHPYPWTPAGTHIILLTGIAQDGNVLVRDSANCTSLSDPNSLRPGPRHYDAQKLQIASATVVVPPWLPPPGSALPPRQENGLSIGHVPGYFQNLGNNRWKCTKTGVILQNNILLYYQQVGIAPYYGLTLYGLPLTEEASTVSNTTFQLFERGILAYDHAHVLDRPPGSGDVYPMHLDSGQGKLALLALYGLPEDLISKIQQMKTQIETFLSGLK